MHQFWGKLADIAKDNEYNFIQILGDNRQELCLGFILHNCFFLFKHYGFIDNTFEMEFGKSIELLNKRKEHIKAEAKKAS